MSSSPVPRSPSPSCWAVVPAAGVGKRMGSDIPKQYLELNGKTILQHTIERLATHPAIAGIIVAVSEDDAYWPSLQLNISKPLLKVNGGSERCYSVLNALQALKQQASDNDWVLVHDAARPCLRQADLDKLITQLKDDEVGGILAVPVRDTMKRADARQHIVQTVDRNQLWHALTPQMFHIGVLYDALQSALDKSTLVTDEASAMELAGLKPKLVEGHADNIKITRPEDLALAGFFLQQQEA